MTSWGSNTAWGAPTPAWGNDQSFGAPSQNFGAPPPTINGSSWGADENPSWIPNEQRSAPVYDADGVAARQDKNHCYYDANGWKPHSDPPQPSASKNSSSSQGYKSPNDWLDASRITGITLLSPEGYPLHAFNGQPVSPQWVHGMGLTYPDRSWEELCKNGPLPKPRSHLGPAERHWVHAPTAPLAPTNPASCAPRSAPQPRAPLLPDQADVQATAHKLSEQAWLSEPQKGSLSLAKRLKKIAGTAAAKTASAAEGLKSSVKQTAKATPEAMRDTAQHHVEAGVQTAEVTAEARE